MPVIACPKWEDEISVNAVSCPFAASPIQPAHIVQNTPLIVQGRPEIRGRELGISGMMPAFSCF